MAGDPDNWGIRGEVTADAKHVRSPLDGSLSDLADITPVQRRAESELEVVVPNLADNLAGVEAEEDVDATLERLERERALAAEIESGPRIVEEAVDVDPVLARFEDSPAPVRRNLLPRGSAQVRDPDGRPAGRRTKPARANRGSLRLLVIVAVVVIVGTAGFFVVRQSVSHVGAAAELSKPARLSKAPSDESFAAVAIESLARSTANIAANAVTRDALAEVKAARGKAARLKKQRKADQLRSRQKASQQPSVVSSQPSSSTSSQSQNAVEASDPTSGVAASSGSTNVTAAPAGPTGLGGGATGICNPNCQ